MSSFRIRSANKHMTMTSICSSICKMTPAAFHGYMYPSKPKLESIILKWIYGSCNCFCNTGATYLILSYLILSYLILSYKSIIERLSQYWQIRGAFSAEAPGGRNVLRERQDVVELPDVSLARSTGGRPF